MTLPQGRDCRRTAEVRTQLPDQLRVHFPSAMKATMERQNQGAFLQALRSYLGRPEDQDAKQEVIQTVPKRGAWFLCTVDGQDYAVRVLQTGRIEVMRSIFSQRRTRASFSSTTVRTEVLALPLFRDG